MVKLSQAMSRPENINKLIYRKNDHLFFPLAFLCNQTEHKLNKAEN